MKIDTAWHNYYFRVIGVLLAGGGIGLMLDEIVNGIQET